jgi:hypothetical protein
MTLRRNQGGKTMYTLFDFMTHVKGIEYIISVLSIAAFMVFWEVLKPKPFATVVSTGKEDLAHLKESGDTIKYVRQLVAAPFIGLAYIVILPLGFFIVLMSEAVNLVVKGVSTLLGKDVSFDWRPMEAYFTGKKRKQKEAGSGKGAK